MAKRRSRRKPRTARRTRRTRRRKAVRSMVTIDLPERPLAYADAIFRVFVGEKPPHKFGEIRLSQGGLDWRGRAGKRWRRYTWRRLARVLDNL